MTLFLRMTLPLHVELKPWPRAYRNVVLPTAARCPVQKLAQVLVPNDGLDRCER